MQVIDVKLRLSYRSTMCNISKDFPDARLMLWCNGTMDVIQISAKESDYVDDVIAYLRQLQPIQVLIRDNGSVLTMVMEYICDGIPLERIAEEHGCFLIGPKTYSKGWEGIRLFAPDRSKLRRYVSHLELCGEVELISTRDRRESDSLRELGIAPVPFFAGLTERQIEVLLSAYEGGLLKVHAATKMEVLAKKVGLSRSTYGEHLRKAIQTLVDNSYPVLKLYSSSYANPPSLDEERSEHESFPDLKK